MTRSQPEDPWADRRGHPTFEAVCDVLFEHPECVIWSPDWRPWLWENTTCPLEDEQRAKGRPTRSSPCGDPYRPFLEGRGRRGKPFAWGSGDVERFAGGLARDPEDPLTRQLGLVVHERGEPLSVAVRRSLAKDYELETREPNQEWHTEWHQRRHAQLGRLLLSFDELLEVMGFTEQVFSEFDARYRRRLRRAIKDGRVPAAVQLVLPGVQEAGRDVALAA